MNLLKIMAGKILYYMAKAISFLLDVVIGVIEVIVGLVVHIAKGFLALIGLGGCFLFIFLAGPIGISLLLNPIALLIIMFFIILPILGTKFVSYLKYIKYMITEYLFDRAAYLLEGKKQQFKSFNEYGNKYKRMEEERFRREQRERQERQQREWEERFRRWHEYQQSQRNFNGYGNHQTFVDPSIEFKSKYEKSCQRLGIPYDADKYQIKLAYRKKAKEYHPDLNKSPDATRLFQQINDAYDFLSDGNIERYKGMR